MASMPSEEHAIYWLEEPAEFEIIDGVACCTIRSGGVIFKFRSKVTTAQSGANSWACAFAAHLTRQVASVIQFPRKRRGH